MTLLQRIRTPFAEAAPEGGAWPPAGSRTVGELLRERREDLGLDLDGIGAALRIKPTYLMALEEGRASELPGPTYAIGFVRAYADHLGLDSDKTLWRFKAEAAGLDARPDLSFPMPLAERSLPGGAMLLVALILALCGYGTWYYLSTGGRSRPERVAEIPATLLAPTSRPAATPASAASGASVSREAALAAGPTIVPGGAAFVPGAGTPAEASPVAVAPVAAAPPSAGLAGIPAPAAAVPSASAAAAPQIVIRAHANCWIQVRDANRAIVFSRVLKAGETYPVPQRSGLTMRTGNAGALDITVDGKPAPAIGGVGTLRRDVALDPASLLAGTAIHG